MPCGHDMHTSSLLATANILSHLQSEFSGTVKFIFQPGEERRPGGASLMIKEEVLDNPKPESIIGQHVMPELPFGKVGFTAGTYMASSDDLYITVTGKVAMERYYLLCRRSMVWTEPSAWPPVKYGLYRCSNK